MSTQPQPLCPDSQAEPPPLLRQRLTRPRSPSVYAASSLECSAVSMPPPVPYSQQQHHALTIPKIVGLICEHLEVLAEPHHEGSGNRRNLEDLTALARTCRDFENPALDILWKEQNTLANALKCLPSNLWEETLIPNDGSYCLHLSSAAKGAEWNRPLAHARRVRRLMLDDWSSPYAFPDRDLLEIISSSLPQEYLFPNLRSIHLDPHDDAELLFIPLFAGPQLSDITLSIESRSSRLINLIWRIPWTASIPPAVDFAYSRFVRFGPTISVPQSANTTLFVSGSPHHEIIEDKPKGLHGGAADDAGIAEDREAMLDSPGIARPPIWAPPHFHMLKINLESFN
ncbi:hypothetical protein B0H13DRAFT_1887356 [Mycena leptocephala]|nr:hypothetical protein B0H13DRAFT_1887356 [Mycena leptocephala]